MEKPEMAFGEYVKARREALGKTVRTFAGEIGISPAYLSDIEKGARPAPDKFLGKFIEVLRITDSSEIHRFYDLAGLSQNGQHTDINSYLDDKPYARLAMRTASDQGLTDADWQRLVELIKSGQIH